MVTPLEHIENLNLQDEETYQETIVKEMGYDPKKEMRVNKLELMCRTLNSTPNNHHDAETGKPISKEGIAELYRLLENVKPILFKMTDEYTDKIIDREAASELGIDIPFQTFSLEPANDWHSLFSVKDEKGLMNCTYIILNEIKPDHLVTYAHYNYIPNDYETPVSQVVVRSNFRFRKNQTLYTFLATYLARLNNKSASVEYKARVKFKAGKNKKTLKIKTKAIYIDQARKYTAKTFNGRPIEWTHSWEVRGHWRRFNGIGKNRDGERVVEGWTRVKSHTRGDGELLIKDRIVK